MENYMETTIMGYIGTTIRILSFIPSGLQGGSLRCAVLLETYLDLQSMYVQPWPFRQSVLFFGPSVVFCCGDRGVRCLHSCLAQRQSCVPWISTTSPQR